MEHIRFVGRRLRLDLLARPPPRFNRFPYTTLFRSRRNLVEVVDVERNDLRSMVARRVGRNHLEAVARLAFKIRIAGQRHLAGGAVDAERARKSTRLNYSHRNSR